MALLLKNLKTIAPCLLAITVDSLGFGLVYPILTMMFAGTHRTFLGPHVPAAEADSCLASATCSIRPACSSAPRCWAICPTASVASGCC